MHRFWIVAAALVLAAAPALAKPEGRPLASVSDPKVAASERWSVEESWSPNTSLIYTFNADGSFQSSNWNKGQSYGTWARHGTSFVMIWPAYQSFYIGNISDAKIEGDAYEMTGEVMGTFKMRRVAEPKTP